MPKRNFIMKTLHLFSLLLAATVLVSCSPKPSPPATVAPTNASAREFKMTNGSTVRLGALVIDGTNVPMTNVQVH
jgi:hypothetical protein